MNDEITSILSIVLAVMVVILLILGVIYAVLLVKMKNSKEEKKLKKVTSKPTGKAVSEKEKQAYNKQSIFAFMDFDKIEDNMIVRKNGRRYLMAIECQGINYDLMSGLEKNGVEQGFIQFLNTLRYPIQLYIQTRTVNLESGIIRYKDRINQIRDRLAKKEQDLFRKEQMGYSAEEINDARLEVTRERNLYEYGLDIVNNTERLSLNKNILRKHYYIIIEYMPEDVTNLAKEEVSSMAFSELYTKAQTIISSLSVCGINGKVLDSTRLAELLYVAYNRDEAEVYELSKALRAGYDELYLTAPDVLSKRMKEIDKKIEHDANQLANDTVMEVIADEEEARKVREKEAEMDELIRQMAKMVLKDSESYIGKDLVEKASKKIDSKEKETRDKEVKNEKKQKATRNN